LSPRSHHPGPSADSSRSALLPPGRHSPGHVAPDTTSSAVRDLATAKQYLPLTLFTTENRIALGLRSEQFAKKNITIEGVKHSVLAFRASSWRRLISWRG
jgi:hypothetical protein